MKNNRKQKKTKINKIEKIEDKLKAGINIVKKIFFLTSVGDDDP